MLFRTPKVASEPGSVANNEPKSKIDGPARVDPGGDDTLAASLTYLAAYHGRAVSREALLGGLPILDGRLSVALYDRAARRAGLETEAIKRDILDIPALVLPAVLIMKNGTALILLGVDQANQSVKVLDPWRDQTRRGCSVSKRLALIIPAMHSLSGLRRKLTHGLLQRATCHEVTGSGQLLRCTGAVMDISLSPPC